MSKVLGLSAGTAGGSAEIVLRLALDAAGDASAELVRLADLDLTRQSDLPDHVVKSIRDV